MHTQTYVENFTTSVDEKLALNGWKGMVVTSGREAVAMYGKLLEGYRDPGEVEVIYADAEGDADRMRQFHTTS